MSDWTNSIEKAFEMKPADLSQMTTVRDNKPYKCQHCVKAFANNSYLTQHMRIHLGIKPFGPCQYCNRKFTQLSHLQQHIRTHTGEKPYKCKFADCDKSFSQLSNLQSHSRCHQNDKPFKCNSCYKCFLDEAALLEHIPKHKESKHLKVHICTFCGKSYTQSLYLEKHMAKHSEQRQHRKYNYGEFANDGFDGLNQLQLNNLHSGSGVSLNFLPESFQQMAAAAAASAPNNQPLGGSATVTAAAYASYPTLSNTTAANNQVISNPTISPFDLFNRQFQRENMPGALRNGNERSAGFNMITPLENIKQFNENATATSTPFNNCA